MFRQKMNKVVSVILAMALVLLLVACGSSQNSGNNNTTGGAQDGSDIRDSIVVGFNNSVSEFSPENPNNQYIGWFVYETLYTEVSGGGDAPLLATEEYEVVDDLHYKVSIYDNIVDSAGNPLKADDVVYSYNKAIEFGNLDNVTQYVEKVEALDETTIQFTWTKDPSKIGVLREILCKVFVFTQASYEASSDGFATKPIGTGPYVIDEFVVDSYVTLKANEDYWQTDDSHLGPYSARNVNNIRFDCITESSQTVVALKNGNIDFASGISYDNLQSFQEGGDSSKGKEIYTYMDNSVYFLTPNTSENSLCQDENLRKAIYYAIDNTQLCSAINVKADPLYTMCSAVYPEFELASELASQENYITQYDPDLAKEYLDKSSWNGESLKMLLTNNEIFQNVGTIIQALLFDNLGITVEFLTYDNATVKEYKSIDDMWDLVLESRASPNYATAFLMGMFDRNVRSTAIFADDDDELNAAVTPLETLDGLTEENWTAFHDYLVDKAYVYPLFNTYVYCVYNSDAFNTIVLNARNTIVPGACDYK